MYLVSYVHKIKSLRFHSKAIFTVGFVKNIKQKLDNAFLSCFEVKLSRSFFFIFFYCDYSLGSKKKRKWCFTNEDFLGSYQKNKIILSTKSIY